MQKTQLEDSEPKRGWPSKKVMAGRSGKVFSLDFLFIEQPYATERAKRDSYDTLSERHAPADTER
jgi:hypothetical protein